MSKLQTSKGQGDKTSHICTILKLEWNLLINFRPLISKETGWEGTRPRDESNTGLFSTLAHWNWRCKWVFSGRPNIIEIDGNKDGTTCVDFSNTLCFLANLLYFVAIPLPDPLFHLRSFKDWRFAIEQFPGISGFLYLTMFILYLYWLGQPITFRGSVVIFHLVISFCMASSID